MKNPPANALAHDILEGAKLTQALARLLRDSAASRMVKLGTLTFLCGRALAAALRESEADFEATVHLVVRNLRKSALGGLKPNTSTPH